MSKYQQFIFYDYHLDEASKKLDLIYKLDGAIVFKETYTFDFPWSDNPNKDALDRAIQNLFFMAGVSYYKAYLPPEIVVNKGSLDETSARFYAKTYQRGLGEFFYKNGLDPKTVIPFNHNSEELSSLSPSVERGQLIGIGGGKDSLVSVELLRDQPRVATWSIGNRAKRQSLVDTIGLDHLWVQRDWDRQLLDLKNSPDAYNGHIPISAILASVGVVVTILADYSDVVVSNESSASEPNLTYKGVEINHQYSKSLEFEKDFQAHLLRHFSGSIRYYSFLRPLSELYISDIFAKTGFEKYKPSFTSCNRAFVYDNDGRLWCGECPKCAFVFLALTPFVSREKLEALWDGNNLLLTPDLESTYKQLLGIEGDKPFECVGEIKEARSAMELAKKIYPELEKYKYELPTDYDYKKMSEHAMPDEIYRLLSGGLDKVFKQGADG